MFRWISSKASLDCDWSWEETDLSLKGDESGTSK